MKDLEKVEKAPTSKSSFGSSISGKMKSISSSDDQIVSADQNSNITKSVGTKLLKGLMARNRLQNTTKKSLRLKSSSKILTKAEKIAQFKKRRTTSNLSNPTSSLDVVLR